MRQRHRWPLPAARTVEASHAPHLPSLARKATEVMTGGGGGPAGTVRVEVEGWLSSTRSPGCTVFLYQAVKEKVTPGRLPMSTWQQRGEGWRR